MSLKRQREWLAKQKATMMGCPACGKPYCGAGNEYGDPNELLSDGKTQYSPMFKCPNPECGIISTEGMDLTGNRWWAVMENLKRIPEDE